MRLAVVADERDDFKADTSRMAASSCEQRVRRWRTSRWLMLTQNALTRPPSM
jgi:hypothetical protein